ncbi:MAG: glycosyltransferase [Rubrivivax sp.]|nr:glycosyltransferase [Rubrivivax sp.]
MRPLGLALLAIALALLWPNLFGGTEHVRVRNALQLGADWSEADDWRPPQRPPGYRFETTVADARLTGVVRSLELDRLPDDWSRARAIGRHLLGSAPKLVGNPIQSSLWGTYERIVRDGEGYCGDFVRVFQAMANAAGLTVRPWAFSFDGFGGHGHIWVEMWNGQQQRWQLIDIFDNFYFVKAGSEEPLSALQLRRALLEGSAAVGRGLELRRLVPEARPGYDIEAKAWEYFQRGVDQWYMPFGNNVSSIDAAPAVKMFSGWSRIGEGVGVLVSGRAPEIRILASDRNATQREALRAVRLRVLAAVACGALGLLALLLSPWLSPRRQTHRASPRREGPNGWPRVCIVGPLPPPSGGMANQCEQLLRLLREDGARVALVRTNAPYRPAWVGKVPVLRAGVRLLPYGWTLWRTIGQADVVHVFANSGWAWHLFAYPALLVGRLRGVPVIVNYRGGQADEFFARAPRWVLNALRHAAKRVTPSPFLLRVFAKHGLDAEIIPNIIDTQRFHPREPRVAGTAPHVIVTRNLEPIYDIPTAIRAFATIRKDHPGARLTVAGSGPQLGELQSLVADMGLSEMVRFSGRIENAQIGDLYADADLLLNPSTADNMPISILEALASGVPVVTTSAGGIPDLVRDGHTALIVPVGDPDAMAAAALRLLSDPALAWRLRSAGVREAARYTWPQVRELWQHAYQGVLAQPSQRLATR